MFMDQPLLKKRKCDEFDETKENNIHEKVQPITKTKVTASNQQHYVVM